MNYEINKNVNILFFIIFKLILINKRFENLYLIKSK